VITSELFQAALAVGFPTFDVGPLQRLPAAALPRRHRRLDDPERRTRP